MTDTYIHTYTIVRIDPSLRPTTHWALQFGLTKHVWVGFCWPARAAEVLNHTESIGSETALASTSFWPTLKPVPLESPPGLPPSLSHGWGVHSTSIPVDSCALVMCSSYLSTSVQYSDGFMSHCISWSCTVIVHLASSTLQIGTLHLCHFMIWHTAECHIQDIGI